MTDIKELIRALRCSNEVHTKENEPDCTKCRYFVLDKIDEAVFPGVKWDVIIDGVPYWNSCDIDAMTRDAIRVLENMEKQPE